MKRRVALALVVLGLTLMACSRPTDRALPEDRAQALVENRNWLDRWPTSPDDRLFVYRFTPQMGGGVYQDRTLFSGRFELFTYRLEPGVVTIAWPDRHKREVVHYQIDEVQGPAPFDLRLTLRGTSLGPTVFYGMRDEGGSDLEASLRSRLTGRVHSDR